MKTELKLGDTEVQVGLDRFVIGIPYPKPPIADDANPVNADQINLFQAQKKEFVANMKHIENMITNTTLFHCSKTHNKDVKRFKVLSDVDSGLLCVFSLGFNYGTGLINFEVNPSRLTQDNWAEIHGLLPVLFNDHYDEVYGNGVIAHAEFYFDVPGVDLSSLVLIDSSRRTTTNYMGTKYYGRRCSRHVATMYDKAKEQKQDGQLVRVEARINRRDIRLQNLVEGDLVNPFGNLLVVDAKRLHSVAQEMKAPKLANQIKEFGLYGAVKNKPAREAILNRLNECPVSWWEPEIIWAEHRELLQQLKPCNGL